MLELEKYKEIDFELRNKICVTKPYFALNNIKNIEDTIFRATVTIENINSEEQTFISAAEAGRHLAILGLTALASENQKLEKHYYLATQALLIRGENSEKIFHFNDRERKLLILEAEVILLDLDKKIGKVKAKIFTEDDELIFSINVTYKIMKEDLFQKIFQSNYIEINSPEGENPYTKNCKIDNVSYNNTILQGDLGLVSASQCLGHFQNYPALPVAILCSAMSDFAAMHLFRLIKSIEKYSVFRADMTAYRLAFAGEFIQLNSTFIGVDNLRYQFLIQAVDTKKSVISEMELFLDVDLV